MFLSFPLPSSDRWVILYMFVMLAITSRVIASPDKSGRGNLIAKLKTATVGLRNLAWRLLRRSDSSRLLATTERKCHSCT